MTGKRIKELLDQNYMEGSVSPVNPWSRNIATSENSTKIYAAKAVAGKVMDVLFLLVKAGFSQS